MASGNDDRDVAPDGTQQQVDQYLGLYHAALPQVYGYVVRRVESTLAAEDITADTFMSAMATIKRGTVVDLSVPWLIGVARHKVADHWRRRASDERRIEAMAQQESEQAQQDANTDVWDTVLDAALAHQTLGQLSTNHRAVLTLRYLDGLPVGEIAHVLGRTIGATEALLTRAKAAFRAAYPTDNSPDPATEPSDPEARHA